MSHLVKRRRLLAVILGRHHVRFWPIVSSWWCHVAVFVIVVVGTATIVIGAFMFIGATMLYKERLLDRIRGWRKRVNVRIGIVKSGSACQLKNIRRASYCFRI